MPTDDEAAWHEVTLVAGEIFKDIDGNLRPGGMETCGARQTAPPANFNRRKL
jgi:hypothetical protein